MFIPPRYPPIIVQPESISKLLYIKLQYPTYVKDIDLDVHINIFKKMINANGETMQTNIMNLFNFTLRDNILDWGENFVQDHHNYTFEELQQVFCKCF